MYFIFNPDNKIPIFLIGLQVWWVYKSLKR
jgi:hypothetical protein